jgi:DNA-binding beta-propeller fold protein YncE
VAGDEGVPGYTDGSSSAAVAEFNQPTAITYNAADGCIYVGDSGNGAIRKISFTTPGVFNATTVSTVVHIAGSAPYGVAISATSGLLYFADVVSQGIYSITTSGTGQTTVAGGGGMAGFQDGVGSSAHFYNPRQMFWTTDPPYGEVLYIADPINARIRKLLISTATVSTYSGSATVGLQNGDCKTAEFNHPRCVANGISGEFYVTDSLNNLIREIQ